MLLTIERQDVYCLVMPPLRRVRCINGHLLKTSKKRQRCPICQSRYLREWRARQKRKGDSNATR